jgi:ligand-binding sensor domain-containing protein
VNYVNDIQFDANQDMWLGTDNGLWKYDGTTWTVWNESNSAIAANYVTCVRFGNEDYLVSGSN